MINILRNYMQHNKIVNKFQIHSVTEICEVNNVYNVFHFILSETRANLLLNLNICSEIVLTFLKTVYFFSFYSRWQW